MVKFQFKVQGAGRKVLSIGISIYDIGILAQAGCCIFCFADDCSCMAKIRLAFAAAVAVVVVCRCQRYSSYLVENMDDAVSGRYSCEHLAAQWERHPLSSRIFSLDFL